MHRVELLETRVLTLREVSYYLKVHRSTVYRLVKNNRLPAFRVGNDWRFFVESIDQWRAEAESLGLATAAAVRQPQPEKAQSRTPERASLNAFPETE
jgi:excisionase family DNA binding protein